MTTINIGGPSLTLNLNAPALAAYFAGLADAAQREADAHAGQRQSFCDGQAHAFRFAAKTITEGIKS